ncbi:MAG: hypothetical protein ACRENQ_00265 [Gemmatimonadaceae bacterium]
MSLVVGLVGGGMLGVLVAKVVGWAYHCSSDPNTGAPCSWGAYWFFGAVAGALIFPAGVLFLRHRGRRAVEKSDRG